MELLAQIEDLKRESWSPSARWNLECARYWMVKAMSSVDDENLKFLREKVQELEAENEALRTPAAAAAIFLDSDVGRPVLASVGKMRVALEAISAAGDLEGAKAIAQAALKSE